MAKSIIEKAPFKFSELPQNLTPQKFEYVLKYKETVFT